jgi:class 3 adenylate cyclase/tetratricopeptide (TPR) repeat protein
VTIGAHRKVVTVLFCDVVGSTALGESVDPEALEGLLARYFERMSAIVESHGGTVEKFIGDAVMAVFGVPVAHEDDALRACRAAVEMRAALPELGVEGRIGVNTGEVLTGTEERLATGDAVNVAARLEQAADPGEVLIGAETLSLAASTVEVGDERLLELKGKSRPIAAYPLVTVGEAAERLHAIRFVGRERELEQIADAWGRALVGPRCELVTIVGDPGVGKSRLVAEALERIGARVVRGHCLSYGEGITYWPVTEVVKQLDVLPSDDSAAKAIRSLLGESEAVAGTDEIAWAFRKLLEEQAPLVVCFDDVQWAEETFLNLVESTALLSTGAPLLIVCMARPELLDRRPSWPTTLRLEPLPAEAAGALIGDAVSDEVRKRIVTSAGGNPLFVIEMMSLAGDAEDVEVPATLRALLAARLDQLDEPERRVLERAAVEGELFHGGTLQALAPQETEVTPHLASLVRRDLVRPDQPQLPREDAYRFRHLLIRDAAYDALPKATRAELHRRFAGWLEEHGQSLVELDEILGYHFEQAARYLAELGRADPEVGLVAGERLGAAGRLAFLRGDLTAAVKLLERSLELLRPHRLDVHLELQLANASVLSDTARALDIAEAAALKADAAGDEAGAAFARVTAADFRVHTGRASVVELEEEARKALPLLEAAGDDAGVVQAWLALALVANGHSRNGAWAEAIEHAILRARAGGPDVRMWGLGIALAEGPRPATEALAAFDALLPEQPHPKDLVVRGVLLAMLGRVEEAWAVALPAAERAHELGWDVATAFLGQIAMVAGDEAAAAAYLRSACEAYEAAGNISTLSTYAPLLGRVLCSLGRYDDATPLAALARELGDSQDLLTQVFRLETEALLRSHGKEHAEAERLARDAVSWVERSDSPYRQGDALSTLATVLGAAGRRDEAIGAWQDALGRYESKGIVPLAGRVRERVAELQPA